MTAQGARERIKMIPQLQPLVVLDMEHPHESAGQWLKLLDKKLGEIKKICKEEGYPEFCIQVAVANGVDDDGFVCIDNGEGDELEFDEGFWEFIGINELILQATCKVYFYTRTARRRGFQSSFPGLKHIEVYWD